MIALSEEGARHPVPIPRERSQRVTALADGASQVGEALVFVGAVARIVPADVVKDLVTRRELDLTESLVRFDTGRELDLVPVRVVAAAPASVEADDAATLSDGADIRGESAERAARELVARRHVHVAPLRPPPLAQRRELAGRKPLRVLELRAIIAHRLSVEGRRRGLGAQCRR